MPSLSTDPIASHHRLEASINATYWVCQRDQKLRRLPIGRPIANAQIYLLDPLLQQVPIGVVGEIHIGGYLNQPQLTAEKFIPSPFAILGKKMYARQSAFDPLLPASRQPGEFSRSTDQIAGR